MIFLSGLILGILSGTITESFGHKLFGHPNETQLKYYFKFKKYLFPFLKPYYQHLIIHHYKTYKTSFLRQFESKDYKKNLDQWIEKTFSSSFSRLIYLERYNLTLKGLSGTIPFALPFLIGPLIILLFLGVYGFLGSLLTAFIPVWMSKFIHPLVHQPHETCKAHPFIQWLMKTKYMELVFINHYIHHQNLNSNFNLLLGGDYVLGLHQNPTKKQKYDMELALNKFRSRVRMSIFTAETSNIDYSYFDNKLDFESSKEDYHRIINTYLSKKTPSFRQRKLFQRELSKYTRTPSTMNGSHKRNYGMNLYDRYVQFKSWSKDDKFNLNNYPQKGNVVFFQGAQFHPGDILLTNQNIESDGLLSTLLTDEVSFSHAALYLLLEKNGEKYPAVIEMNEFGIQALPLKAFLTEDFNSYIEVFRYTNKISKSEINLLNQAAHEMMDEAHSFDIYQDINQDKNLNCSRTIVEIFKRAGIVLKEGQSRYHNRTQKNLDILGIGKSFNKNFHMPDDFITSGDFIISSIIDYEHYNLLLSRSLVLCRFQEIWRSMVLERANYPFSYYYYSYLIDKVQRNTVLGKIFLKFYKMEDSFPSGPLMFLSLTPIADKAMKKASIELHRHLMNHIPRLNEIDDWDYILNDSLVRSILIDSCSEFSVLFNRDPVFVEAFNNEIPSSQIFSGSYHFQKARKNLEESL